ncbi:hypothetical protein [Burkholderia gladioli]|uniref:hypothetical protein n=1 Tax=Burkholderia gladioli TaxID=28095 RepID=UPI001641B694|nr:hypothetical protein [Burkholderia gladioli]
MIAIQRWRRLLTVGGVMLSIAPLSYASCSIVKDPIGIRSQVSLVGFVDGSQRLKSSELTSEFTFKCDAETDYGMTANVAGATSGVVELQSTSGVRVPLNIKLKSINGQKVDVLFKDMRDMTYQNHASAGQIYQVTIELVPAEPRLPRGRVAGSLIGSVRFVIGY